MSKELLDRIITSVNQNNNERLEDEVVITNIPNIECLKTIGWQTKRIGKVAYRKDGFISNGYLPVFVKKEEILLAD